MSPCPQPLKSPFQSPGPEAASTRCVLYVEDHPVNVELMQAIFTCRPDCALIVATDGESGMEAARRIKPDLLLLDINLPDCVGTELLERMRGLAGWDDVPAVAVTAEHGFDTDGTTFCERWPKPISLQDTLGNLDRLLLDHGNRRAAGVPPVAANERQPSVAGRV
jgi:CheY-like chemotaxis protein